jgi:HEAT repeat protein
VLKTISSLLAILAATATLSAQTDPDQSALERLRRYPSAILARGEQNDAASIPLMEQIVAAPVPTEAEIQHQGSRRRKDVIEEYREAGIAAKMALTKMKVHDYFDEFVVGLSTSDADWKSHCADALGYIGDRRAVRHLIPLLDDVKMVRLPPRQRRGKGSEVNVGASVSAAQALEKLLPQEAAKLLEAYPAKDTSAPRPTPADWKKWWQDNKAKYSAIP